MTFEEMAKACENYTASVYRLGELIQRLQALEAMHGSDAPVFIEANDLNYFVKRPYQTEAWSTHRPDGFGFSYFNAIMLRYDPTKFLRWDSIVPLNAPEPEETPKEAV